VTSLLSGMLQQGRWETESLPAAVGGSWEGSEVVVFSERKDSVFSSWGRVPNSEANCRYQLWGRNLGPLFTCCASDPSGSPSSLIAQLSVASGQCIDLFPSSLELHPSTRFEAVFFITRESSRLLRPDFRETWSDLRLLNG